VSNAVTTTNIYAATERLTGATGQTSLDVTGNVYASNALTTTNIYAATERLTGATGQTSLDVTGNIYASNAVTTTNVIASSLRLASSTITVPSGTLQFNSTAGIYNATIGTLRGIAPIQYRYVMNADYTLTELRLKTPQPMMPSRTNGITLPIGKYYVDIVHNVRFTASATGISSYLGWFTGGATYTPAITLTAFRYAAIYILRHTSKDNSGAAPTGGLVSAVAANANYTTVGIYRGTIDVTVAGTFNPSFVYYNDTAGTSAQSGSVLAGSSVTIQPLGATGADINIGGWS
jgi:hypothetical protein